MGYLDNNGLTNLWKKITDKLNNKADKNHTHNYADPNSIGSAINSANKLDANADFSAQPVYFSNSILIVIDYTIVGADIT